MKFFLFKVVPCRNPLKSGRHLVFQILMNPGSNHVSSFARLALTDGRWSSTTYQNSPALSQHFPSGWMTCSLAEAQKCDFVHGQCTSYQAWKERPRSSSSLPWLPCGGPFGQDPAAPTPPGWNTRPPLQRSLDTGWKGQKAYISHQNTYKHEPND